MRCTVSLRQILPSSIRTRIRPVPLLGASDLVKFKGRAFLPLEPLHSPQESRHLPAIERWFDCFGGGVTLNTNHFRPFLAHLVPLEISETNESGDATSFDRVSLPLGTIFTHQGRKNLYIAQASINDLPEPLQSDLPTPDLVRSAGRGEIYDSSIWLGQAPTYTPLHRDPNPNYFVQLAGKKKVRLLAPEVGDQVFREVQRLVQSGGNSRFRGDEMMLGPERKLLERIVWEDSSLEEILEVELEAGDAMVIPKGFWHSVKGIGEGITGSANWWFR